MECISPNQTSFLKGQSLGKNVLLAFELIKNNEKLDYQGSCTFNVNVHKPLTRYVGTLS